MNCCCCRRNEYLPSLILKTITILCLFVGTITIVSGFVINPPTASTTLHKNAKTKRQRRFYYARESENSTPVNTSPPEPSITTNTHTYLHRRSLLASLLTTTTTPLLLLTTTPLPSHAACLPGDDSPSCIGIYKVPIDDAILPYTSTPERLATYAPGIKWVPPITPPSSYRTAVDELRQIQKQMDDVRDCILRGDLEGGGVLLLRLMPRVTAAGRVVERTLDVAGDDSLSMRAYRVSVALENLQGLLGQCDVMIGQGLRGEMGALTVAQIGILSGLDEVVTEWRELMVAIPEGEVGGKAKKRGK